MTASGTASVALTEREKSLCNGINPWLAPVAMVLTQDVALKGFFGGGLTVLGRENLPDDGPVLLAPTHRSRWDALMLPHAAGRRVTGRDCRFMVTSDEMTGLQGWFLHRLGCFPVNPRKPAAASLRFAVDLLEGGNQLVMFPEGKINQNDPAMRLMPGLARLTALAEGQGVSVQVVPVAMVLTQDVALKGFFSGGLTVLGRENLPDDGPVLLAPTHRSRWDALMLPHAAGRRVTGRDCRFMVTSDEMTGLQGWFLHRLGCFPVNPRKPAAASLRFAVDLLEGGNQLVMFPEGKINQNDPAMRLMPGLARLTALAEGQGVAVQVVPVGIAYGHAKPRLGDQAALCFGPALRLAGPEREQIKALTAELSEQLQAAEQRARQAVGRPLQRP